MTLRARLTLLLVAVVLVGLVVSDVVTYAALRSFLVSRTDPQLEAAAYPVTRALLSRNRLTPSSPFASPGVHRSSRLMTPAGTVGELLGTDGSPIGVTTAFAYGGKPPPPPVLPRPLPAVGSAGTAIFTAQSHGPGPISYRVMIRRLGRSPRSGRAIGPDVTVVVAIPLTGVTDTLDRLRIVELLVSAAIVAGLGVLAWWIVRRDLRPLQDMARTAGTIAAGDLSRRVEPAESRTEVGRLGLALNAMLGEIEGAFAARTTSEERLRRFLAAASHELRTPLTSIRGYAELFDLGARDRPADLATSMRHIREEADRMSLLVDDLLLLARLDQERPLHRRTADVAAVVARSVQAARVGHPDQPVVEELPEHLVVWCDPDRLRQVADNLLANAVWHSPPEAPVEVGLRREGTEMVLEVRDHGPGVRPEDQARIFEPFYRADPSRSRTTGGAGLGLTIVAAIARAHGGSVGLAPPPANGGACFWVRLPGLVAEADGPAKQGGPAEAHTPAEAHSPAASSVGDQNQWSRESGQKMATTLPTISDRGTGPQ